MILMKNDLFNKSIIKVLNQRVKMELQKIFWFYICNIFVVDGTNEFKMVESRMQYEFKPITLDNYYLVRDFREDSRINQYKEKLANKEIGFFAEHNGKMIGSIWATINKTELPNVVRTFIRIMPDEGLIHDIVTGEKFRGMGVAPFMVRNMVSILLTQHGLKKIIIDVNIKNKASLRTMDKLGLRIDKKMFFMSAFEKLIFQHVLRQYN